MVEVDDAVVDAEEDTVEDAVEGAVLEVAVESVVEVEAASDDMVADGVVVGEVDVVFWVFSCIGEPPEV